MGYKFKKSSTWSDEWFICICPHPCPTECLRMLTKGCRDPVSFAQHWFWETVWPWTQRFMFYGLRAAWNIIKIILKQFRATQSKIRNNRDKTGNINIFLKGGREVLMSPLLPQPHMPEGTSLLCQALWNGKRFCRAQMLLCRLGPGQPDFLWGRAFEEISTTLP